MYANIRGMSVEKGSFWSAIVWMLNGILAVTWLYGASLAYQKEGIGQGLLAFFVPPYGVYVAYAQGVADRESATGPGSWFSPGLGSQVTEFEKRCLNQEADREKSGLTEQQFAEFCLCLARATVALRTPEEIRYQEQTGQLTNQFQQRLNQSQQSCAATARFVRPPQNPEAAGGPASD